MGFGDAIKICFAQYATFSGRAARPEYWYFVLFTLLVQIGLGIIGAASEVIANLLSGLFALAVLLPSLAVGARRLHDTDRSGWWLLIGLIPIVGWIVLIVFLCQRGTPGPNRFGDAPVRSIT